MGFWSWFAGEPKVETVDRVWLTARAKSAGICREACDQLPLGRSRLVLAHFPSTLGEIRGALTEMAVPLKMLHKPITVADIVASTGFVLTGLSSDLQPEPFPNAEYDESQVVPVLVCERHFLRSYDDQICEFAKGFPSRSEVVFHLSLDDAMLRPFVGAHVIGMLRQLGMTEENSIDGGLLGRQLRRSQKKLEAKLRDLRDASSPEEWLERNRLE